MSVQLIPTVSVPNTTTDKPSVVVVGTDVHSLVPTVVIPQVPHGTFMYIPIPDMTIPYTNITVTHDNFYYFLIPFVLIVSFIIGYIFYYRSKKRRGGYVSQPQYSYA